MLVSKRLMSNDERQRMETRKISNQPGIFFKNLGFFLNKNVLPESRVENDAKIARLWWAS
jgi:hypothetical protein